MEQGIKTTPAVETWVPVRGFEGLYEVSDLGRVRSLDRWFTHIGRGFVYHQEFHKGRVLKQQINKGYYLVKLCKDGHQYTFQTHRLVAEHFLPNPKCLPVVNHKDENSKNNVYTNLEWCTQKYNVHYGDGIKKNREKHKKYMRTIEQLTKDGKHVAYHTGITQLIKDKGYCERSILRCLNKKPKFKSAYGYIWRYID